ncbi:25S rRNA (adenine(645)-N(1))-methyltransferase [Tetranychus urticae]|uniref:Ribosomal RNA-processing protein 8 n=1 Tax=Tetranychus urticae TaxID=32264 RepID=T1KNR4_TETUR|nr:25S rRNA (adenine(645)-N(1))-methyltransferase [Tetranychus urticae]
MEGTFKPKHCKKLFKLVTKKSKIGKSDNVQQKDDFLPKLKPKNFKIKPKLSRSGKLNVHCKKHLEYSQFRAMNEFIYSNNSRSGFDYMKDADRFNKYHEAYEEIVRKWPVKPVDYIVKKIEEFAGPDWEKEWVIADLGCGKKPTIKQKLPKAKVHSFDAVSRHHDIIASDITKVPLEDHSIDIAVYSLSLMATNIKDLICEANRLLRKKGILMIAEVSSRFEDESVDKFQEKLKQYGFEVVEKQFLPPNDFFVFILATKKKSLKKENISELPAITLKPCLYKPR